MNPTTWGDPMAEIDGSVPIRPLNPSKPAATTPCNNVTELHNAAVTINMTLYIVKKGPEGPNLISRLGSGVRLGRGGVPLRRLRVDPWLASAGKQTDNRLRHLRIG